MAVVELSETATGGESLADCSDDALSYGFTQLELLRRTLLAEQLALVGEVARRESWKVDGAANLAGWITAPTGMADHDAHDMARLAQQLDRMPALAAALAAGAFDLTQAAMVAKLVDLLDDEPAVVADAEGRSVAQLKAALAGARPITAKEAHETHRTRSLRISFDERTGQYRLNARLAPDAGATVEAALARVAGTRPDDWVPDPDPHGHPLPEHYRSQMADALVEICSTELAADADADRATVVIHAPIEVLEGRGSALVTASDAPLGTSTVRRILCDARFELVTDHPGADPYRLGRTTRTIPSPLGRQLRWRDRTCRFPGCGRRRWVHAHHITHWADGGPTDLDNLVLLCGTHHTLLHESGWTLSGHPDGDLTFHRPDGGDWTSRPARLRSDLRRPPPGNRPVRR
ncbi:MAG: HNH endonuclease [Actinomycetota bacterium]|nr:HNH endonuclease [Actinomycetota bacterium]